MPKRSHTFPFKIYRMCTFSCVFLCLFIWKSVALSSDLTCASLLFIQKRAFWQKPLYTCMFSSLLSCQPFCPYTCLQFHNPPLLLFAPLIASAWRYHLLFPLLKFRWQSWPCSLLILWLVQLQRDLNQQCSERFMLKRGFCEHFIWIKTCKEVLLMVVILMQV